MRFTIIDDVREFGFERIPYPTKVKNTKRVEFQGSHFVSLTTESGFRVFDNARKTKSAAFYKNDIVAQIFADKLNRTLPQTVWTPKKKVNHGN